MQTVAVIDYGMGNLHSVAKALEHVGAGRVLVSSDAAVIREADRVVFPGVGAIRDCMAEIRRLGFDALVREVSQTARSSASASACRHCWSAARRTTGSTASVCSPARCASSARTCTKPAST